MALFLYAGPEKTEDAKFAKEFSTKHLKTDFEELNEKTFSKLQQKLDEKTTVFVSNGFTLGADHTKFIETVKRKNVTLLFKDAKPSAMKGYVAVGIDGKYVVVNNAANGRKQRIIQVGSDNYKFEETTESMERKGAPQEDSKKGPMDTSRQITSPPEDPQQVSVKSSPKPDILKLLALWLKDDRFEQMEGKSVTKSGGSTLSEDYAHETIVVLPDFSYEYTFSHAGSHKTTIEGFYSISILLLASNDPIRKKFVKFQQTDACGVRAIGTVEKWEVAGMFIDKARTYICAGTQGPGGWEDGDALPAGWIRSKVEPHTPNTETTYVDTTGFNFSVSGEYSGGGGEAGTSGSGKLTVSAGYSETHQTRKTIPDFSVRNKSSGSTSGWEFYYTQMDGANYWNHSYFRFGWGWAIRPVADLAKSTMHLNAEAVYEAPPDYTDSVDWTVHSRMYAARLESRGSAFHQNIEKHSGYHTRYNNFTLYMDMINVP